MKFAANVQAFEVVGVLLSLWRLKDCRNGSSGGPCRALCGDLRAFAGLLRLCRALDFICFAVPRVLRHCKLGGAETALSIPGNIRWPFGAACGSMDKFNLR